MKKKSIRISLVLVTVLCICLAVYYYYFCSMISLPYGDFKYESTSPQGTYTVKLYLNSPALSAGSIRGELITERTKKKRNIYWEYSRNLFDIGFEGDSIVWEDDDTVVIYGKRLNLPKDRYDWRRDD